jgi:hypothetical protein
MVIAVVAVWVVQVAIHEVIHMVAMGHGFVAATFTMNMALLVPAAGVLRRAAYGVCGSYVQGVLVGVALMRMVQVAIVQVVHMVAMLNGRVTTACAVLVAVVVVLLAVHD